MNFTVIYRTCLFLPKMLLCGSRAKCCCGSGPSAIRGPSVVLFQKIVNYHIFVLEKNQCFKDYVRYAFIFVTIRACGSENFKHYFFCNYY